MQCCNCKGKLKSSEFLFKALQCPHCGMKQRVSGSSTAYLTLAMILVFAVIPSSIFFKFVLAAALSFVYVKYAKLVPLQDEES